jgi:hypothetical protein
MLDELPKPSQERNSLLVNSPFARHILDTNLRLRNQSDWIDKVVSVKKELEKSLIEVLGESWEKITVIPLYISMDAGIMFNPKIKDELKYSSTKTMFMVGYDIGNYNFNPIFNDLIRYFGDGDIFNPKMLNNKGSRKIVNFCLGALKDGAYFRSLFNPTENNNHGNGTKNVFQEYIDNLDI